MDELPIELWRTVADAAIEANLGFRDRELRLAGIPPEVTHALVVHKRPGDQIRADIFGLLRAGLQYLRIHLENLARLAGPYAVALSNAATVVEAFVRGEQPLSEASFEIVLSELLQVPGQHHAPLDRHLAQAVADNFDSALGDPESERAFALLLRSGSDRRVGRSPHPALVRVLAKMAPDDRRFLVLVVTHVCYHAGGGTGQVVCRPGAKGPPPHERFEFFGDEETRLEKVRYRFHHEQLVQLGLARHELKNGDQTIRLEHENSSTFTFELTPTGAMLAACLVPELDGRPQTRCGEGLPYRG